MAKKKTFLNGAGMQDDPALSFISQESIASEPEQEAPAFVPDTTPGTVGKRLRPDPAYIEVKSRRVQLVMQPSLYAKVKETCSQAGISFNEYCCQVLEKAVSEDHI